MKEITCCFTGCRPQSLPWGYNEKDIKCKALKEKLKAEIIKAAESGYTHFISGMAQGVDTYCAEIVLEMKKNRGIFLEAAVPCETQADKWTDKEKQRYKKILSKADTVTVLSKNHTPYCMHMRNAYMVDKSSLVIAVWGGGDGGTQNTINYAVKNGVNITVINP